MKSASRARRAASPARSTAAARAATAASPGGSEPSLPPAQMSSKGGSTPPAAEPATPLSRWQAGLRTGLCHALLLVLAAWVFVVNLGDPPHLFWDENYHVTSAQRYLEQRAQLSAHPPLGLMLVAAGEALSGANASLDKHPLTLKKQVGGEDLPPGFSFEGMRLMPSLFAAAGALMFFGLMLQILRQRWLALMLATLYLCENAFVVHFRAVHLDGFQMFFVLAALWLFVALWQRERALHWLHYAGLAALCALAMMIKVNAAFLLAVLPLLYLKNAAACGGPGWADFARKAVAACAALGLVFFSVFYVHALQGRIAPSGDSPAAVQDLENMSPEFLNALELKQPVTPALVWLVARDSFAFMQKDHKGAPKLDITKPGENGSHPLHWPLQHKTINYRWDSADGKTSYVQLVGNRVSWSLGLLAVLLSALLVANHRVFGHALLGRRATYQLIEVFLGLYLAFMALSLWMHTQRVMYLYHYFLGLMLSFTLVALLWRYLCEQHAWLARHQLKLTTAGAAAVVASFAFFLPLSNHWPLSKDQCEARNVVARVVDCVN